MRFNHKDTHENLRDMLYIISEDISVLDSAEMVHVKKSLRVIPDKKSYKPKKKLVVKK